MHICCKCFANLAVFKRFEDTNISCPDTFFDMFQIADRVVKL